MLSPVLGSVLDAEDRTMDRVDSKLIGAAALGDKKELYCGQWLTKTWCLSCIQVMMKIKSGRSLLSLRLQEGL